MWLWQISEDYYHATLYAYDAKDKRKPGAVVQLNGICLCTFLNCLFNVTVAPSVQRGMVDGGAISDVFNNTGFGQKVLNLSLKSEVANVGTQMESSTVSFSISRVVAETVDWLSLGRRNQLTLIGLLHFPSTDSLAFAVCTNVSLNKLSHTHTDYLPRMLFCAGRMFEMPVTDTVHPPPPTLPHHKYNVPLSSSGRVQSTI